MKPFIDWMWGACLTMAFGGALALGERRYRPRPCDARLAHRPHDDTAASIVLGAAMLVASVGWIVRPRLVDSAVRCTADRGTTVMLLVAVPSIVALLYAQLGRFDALEAAPSGPRSRRGSAS